MRSTGSIDLQQVADYLVGLIAHEASGAVSPQQQDNRLTEDGACPPPPT